MQIIVLFDSLTLLAIEGETLLSFGWGFRSRTDLVYIARGHPDYRNLTFTKTLLQERSHFPTVMVEQRGFPRITDLLNTGRSLGTVTLSGPCWTLTVSQLLSPTPRMDSGSEWPTHYRGSRSAKRPCIPTYSPKTQGDLLSS